MARYSTTVCNLAAVQCKAPATTDASGDESQEEWEEQIQEDPPFWCECDGHCCEKQKQEERICCKNYIKNHEHLLFENHTLTEHNLELAMQNNSDFLNNPFDPSNNGCWRYTYIASISYGSGGKLGRRNRKVKQGNISFSIDR